MYLFWVLTIFPWSPIFLTWVKSPVKSRRILRDHNVMFLRRSRVIKKVMKSMDQTKYPGEILPQSWTDTHFRWHVEFYMVWLCLPVQAPCLSFLTGTWVPLVLLCSHLTRSESFGHCLPVPVCLS